MTVTLSKNEYFKLLEKTKIVPKIIETEAEYEEYLSVAEQLISQKNKRSFEETTLLRLLVKLIEDYEEQTYFISEWANISAHEILQHLMESSGTKESDLIGVIGSEKTVLAIIKGEKNINEIEAKILGDYFNLSPSLFQNNN
jgi:HTH-type transcriptional regulator/antitoxin HigA